MTNKALVEALLQSHQVLEAIANTRSTNFTDVDQRVIANRKVLTALASSGNEAPGDDKGLVASATKRIRSTFDKRIDELTQQAIEESLAEIERAFDVLVSDRDEWRDQHENLLSVRQSDLTALSSGNEVAKVVGWLRGLDRDEWYPSDVADAISRGDHLASDAAPLTGGGGE